MAHNASTWLASARSIENDIVIPWRAAELRIGEIAEGRKA
jgi:hypothetical protein